MLTYFEKIFLLYALKYVALTIIIEFPIVWFLMNKQYRDKRLAITIILMNTITNLSLNTCIEYLHAVDYYNLVTIGEILVVISEAFVLRYIYDLGWKRCLMISLVANIASFVIGNFIMLGALL